MAQIKEIKRYANRRLYDAETSKTITLEDVAECIKKGYEVRVVDNLTGEDITARVLGQTFLKIFQDNKNLEFNNFLMTALIREVSSNVSGFLNRLVQGGIGAASLTVDRLEKIVQSMVEQGELGLADQNSYISGLMTQINERKSSIDAQVQEGLGMLRNELVQPGNTEKIEELSSKLDEMARIIQDIQSRENDAPSGDEAE